MEEERKHGLTRRNLLRLGGMSAAGMVLAACPVRKKQRATRRRMHLRLNPEASACGLTGRTWTRQ